MANGGETMRDDQNSHGATQSIDRVLNESLIGVVQRAGGFVED